MSGHLWAWFWCFIRTGKDMVVMTKDNQSNISWHLSIHLFSNLEFSVFLEVVRDVEGLVNEETKLPCNNVRFEFGEDRAKLIMWFRNGSETPFYM